MSLIDTKEWFIKADDDFEAVQILNEAYKKKIEIMCYLCSQAVEKYLKGFLVYNGIIPVKTHNLEYLVDECIKIENSFKTIENDCVFINKYSAEVRYPNKVDITEDILKYVIKVAEKVKNFEVFNKIREEIKEVDCD